MPKTAKDKSVSRAIMATAKFFDRPKLNRGICLAFNAVGSVFAIIFIVMYFTDTREGMLETGIIGCAFILFANITDRIPFLLMKMVRGSIEEGDNM